MLQDDIERLIPRNVLQNQGDRTTNRIAHYHVHPGELANDLKQASDIDILEVEGQFLALVPPARALHQFIRILDDRLYLDYELIVSLIGIVCPQALRGNQHTGIFANDACLDATDRG